MLEINPNNGNHIRYKWLNSRYKWFTSTVKKQNLQAVEKMHIF